MPEPIALGAVVSALCEMLTKQTGMLVRPGPENNTSGVFVWPFMLEEDGSSRNLPVRTIPGGSLESPTVATVLRFLVLVRPALTIADLSKLDLARRAMLEHPILDIDGKNARISLSREPLSDLAALFTAASMPLTICVSARIRCG